MAFLLVKFSGRIDPAVCQAGRRSAASGLPSPRKTQPLIREVSASLYGFSALLVPPYCLILCSLTVMDLWACPIQLTTICTWLVWGPLNMTDLAQASDPGQSASNHKYAHLQIFTIFIMKTQDSSKGSACIQNTVVKWTVSRGGPKFRLGVVVLHVDMRIFSVSFSNGVHTTWTSKFSKLVSLKINKWILWSHLLRSKL